MLSFRVAIACISQLRRRCAFYNIARTVRIHLSGKGLADCGVTTRFSDPRQGRTTKVKELSRGVNFLHFKSHT